MSDDLQKPARLGKRQLFAASLLILLSLVAKVKIGRVELAGGPTLVGLAAVVLLWPILRQLATRGGSTEFMGLKLQINSLEQKSEQEFGIRISELRADVEQLRAAMKSMPESTKEALATPAIDKELERAFWAAVEVYNQNQKRDDWSARVEADKRLTATAGTLPVSFLQTVLREHPLDQGVAMAAAVALGIRAPSEALERARLLTNLLRSRSERARYRAARSIGRLGARADLSYDEYQLLEANLSQALREELSTTVREAMKAASEALTINPYLKTGG